MYCQYWFVLPVHSFAGRAAAQPHGRETVRVPKASGTPRQVRPRGEPDSESLGSPPSAGILGGGFEPPGVRPLAVTVGSAGRHGGAVPPIEASRQPATRLASSRRPGDTVAAPGHGAGPGGGAQTRDS